jgi:dCMP deaminase
MERISWDEYFMKIAKEISTRATCDRLHVGAVIVKDKTILSTGYNGSIIGQPHCDDVGHLLEKGHCISTVHAEANAIIQAAKNGTAIKDAFIYITAFPCWDCFKLIANSSLRKIYYGELYQLSSPERRAQNTRIHEIAAEMGIKILNINI